jgi:hypothetical protein
VQNVVILAFYSKRQRDSLLADQNFQPRLGIQKGHECLFATMHHAIANSWTWRAFLRPIVLS